MRDATRRAEVAAEILRQLGGGRFTAMTGARRFLATEDGLRFGLGRAKDGINVVTVNLNGRDYYDVEFAKARGFKVSTVGRFEDVSADALRGVFERATGLLTNF